MQGRCPYYRWVAPGWRCQLRMYGCGGVTMATAFQELLKVTQQLQPGVLAA